MPNNFPLLLKLRVVHAVHLYYALSLYPLVTCSCYVAPLSSSLCDFLASRSSRLFTSCFQLSLTFPPLFTLSLLYSNFLSSFRPFCLRFFLYFRPSNHPYPSTVPGPPPSASAPPPHFRVAPGGRGQRRQGEGRSGPAGKGGSQECHLTQIQRPVLGARCRVWGVGQGLRTFSK